MRQLNDLYVSPPELLLGTRLNHRVPVAVLALPGGQLFAAGAFAVFNDTPRNGLVRINANGSIPTRPRNRHSSAWLPQTGR